MAILPGTSSSNTTLVPENKYNKTLSTDAWYRAKAVHDNSILHGMFTFNVPVTKWKESIDSVEQTSFTYATSVNGKLNLTSNGILNSKVKLDTFRNPRYEPNSGHLFATSIFMPSPNAAGQRTFGVFTEDAGIGFRLRGDGATSQLYSVRRTTVDGVTADTESPINTTIDLSKGCTYDTQFQWMGVGDTFFFINQELVHVESLLGTLDELSMFNPAAPIVFECINQGDDVVLQCGCVDVSSEGGEDKGKTYGSISINNGSGSVSVSNFNTPVLVVRNKKEVSGLINTRDSLALLATGYADQRSVLRVWATRDETAITLNSQAWTDFGDGHIERIIYNLNADGTPLEGTPITFDTSKADLVFGCRLDQDQSYATSALFEGRTDIYKTPGDIFIFTIHRETGGTTSVGVTYEFAEAI
jgi:hypothetical protein